MRPKIFTNTIDMLNERACEVFKQIVANYLQAGSPIGSRNLARLLPQSLSPATIRNVMGDLERLGLITAPHVSAGRLPTHEGLRFFIDSFMEVNDLTKEEKTKIKQKIHTKHKNQSIEDFLKDTSQILSDISKNAGMVATTKQELKLKYIEFVRLSEDRALAILITQNGEIENRILILPKNIDNSQLIEASNYLNAHILGRTLEEARRHLAQIREKTHLDLDQLSQELVDKGVALFGGQGFDKKMRLILHGRANLLDNIKERQDLDRVKQLFDDLETQEKISELLNLTEKSEGVRIFIGAENKLFSLSESSLIIAPYQDSEQKIVGVVGVIGPTYVNYARLIPVVNYTARLISQLIS